MTPHDLIAAFEALAEAPEGIARLRELILQLAVRGRLVTQDPKDEEASVLLERIAAQRALLLGSRQVLDGDSASSQIAHIANEKLAKGWQLCRLTDLVLATDAGWSPKCESHPTATPKEWGVLKTTAIQQNSYAEEHHKALPAGLPPRPDLEVSEGDVLVTRAGPWFRVGVAAYVAKTRPRLMLSDKIIRCQLVPGGASGVWVALCINSGPGARWLREQQSGMDSAQMNISQPRLRSVPIPLPPLAEQRRIVARVDELMSLLDRLEAARAKRDTTRAAVRDSALDALHQADTPDEVDVAWNRFAQRIDDLVCDPADIAPLRQTVLQLAVRGRLVRQDPKDEPASSLLERIAKERARLVKAGEIRRQDTLPPVQEHDPRFATPDGWPAVRFGSVIELVSGQHLTPAEYSRSPADLPYLTGPADFGAVCPTATRWTGERRAVARRGDILVTVKGAGIGKTNVLDTPEAAISRQLMAVRPILVDHRFCHLVLKDAAATLAGQQTGIAIPGIGRDEILFMVVAIPPLAEQHRIVARVDELMGLLDRLEARLTAARTVHAAFAAAAVHHLDA